MKELFIFAGEKSGDLHGAHLLKALRKQLPECAFSGVAGPEMRHEKIEVLLPTEEFEIMGFGDILFSLPKIYTQFKKIRNHILHTQPDGVVLIDYPGFNLRLAKSLRKGGYKGKLIQYIAPTFWAWGRKRKEVMIQNLDLLLTIYPFEAAHFKETDLLVEYVGNPVQESVQNYRYQTHWAETLGLKGKEHLIALFPGSRGVEVRRNLPVQLQAALKIKERIPHACFAISCAHKEIMALMQKMLSALPFKIHRDIFFVPKLYSYELMRDSRAALAKSGTVTLELALHKCPTVVMYQMSHFNYWVAKYVLRLNLPNYCMANIILGKTAFPELIKKGCRPQELFEAFWRIHQEGVEREICLSSCAQIDALLEKHNTSERAAQAIVKELVKYSQNP